MRKLKNRDHYKLHCIKETGNTIKSVQVALTAAQEVLRMHTMVKHSKRWNLLGPSSIPSKDM